MLLILYLLTVLVYIIGCAVMCMRMFCRLKTRGCKITNAKTSVSEKAVVIINGMIPMWNVIIGLVMANISDDTIDRVIDRQIPNETEPDTPLNDADHVGSLAGVAQR